MSSRDPQADALAAIARGAQDQLGRDDPIAEDQAVVVDVVDEQVQRPDPLAQPALDPVPLVGGDQAGDRVERDDPLDPLLAAVDGEGDPLVPHQEVGRAVATLQLVGPECVEPLVQRRVMRRGTARARRTSRRTRSASNRRTGWVLPRDRSTTTRPSQQRRANGPESYLTRQIVVRDQACRKGIHAIREPRLPVLTKVLIEGGLRRPSKHPTTHPLPNIKAYW